MFLTVFVALNNIQGHIKKQNFSFMTTVSAFRKNRNLLKIYCVSLALRFFYAAMTIYMPLYLHEIGLTYMQIGAVFTVMLIPFILIEYPAGILADTRYGEKEMLLIGALIIVTSLMWMFFAQSTSFVFWMVILMISRVGAALVESMEDSYFYKQITENDVALINFFRSTRAVAYIICAISVGFSLVFFDIRSVFVVMTCAMALAIYPIIRLRDTQ
jgi:MFS family permease